MQQQPNFLVIVSDQQRWDSLGCNGNVFAQTPNLDAMAARGANFELSFTPFPVCTPARASMWTGVHPNKHGVTYNRYGIDDVISYESKVDTTLFEIMQSAGYRTAYFGKWHLGETNNGRFDIWKGFNSHGGHWEDGRQSFQGGRYKPETQTEEMIRFLESPQAREKPFIAVQSYYPPHNPFTAPAESYAPYRRKGVPFPGYYAAVTALDGCVGAVREVLRRTGLSENTLVLYVSDHGETFNFAEAAPHKWVCQDSSIRVPFLMEGPGVPEGIRPKGLVGLEDLMPTVLAAAGITCPDYIDGANLFDLLDGTATAWRDAYYAQTERRTTRTLQRCIRTKDLKLILSWDEQHEFYDLTIDPEEEFNLFDVPRADKQNQYMHFGDQSGRILSLARMMLSRAGELDDFAGVELASRLLRQRDDSPDRR
ncbi:MAG: sulfatase-like hydrolase/transferase [Boseongicola sp. SB0673_bin_14]|nr:sulfatase-like hydrolase/transferase [Boseongicola sp. SB0667_bin_21]MYI70517.1 sulfatase-like hydrolase/transferase [Boseongicola sp. SB0673_bin_14]